MFLCLVCRRHNGKEGVTTRAIVRLSSDLGLVCLDHLVRQPKSKPFGASRLARLLKLRQAVYVGSFGVLVLLRSCVVCQDRSMPAEVSFGHRLALFKAQTSSTASEIAHTLEGAVLAGKTDGLGEHLDTQRIG